MQAASNVAARGAVIASINGSLEFASTSLTNNTATAGGSVLYAAGGSVSFNGSSFIASNAAPQSNHGATVLAEAGNISFTVPVTFSMNSGGSITVAGPANVSVAPGSSFVCLATDDSNTISVVNSSSLFLNQISLHGCARPFYIDSSSSSLLLGSVEIWLDGSSSAVWTGPGYGWSNGTSNVDIYVLNTNCFLVSPSVFPPNSSCQCAPGCK